MSRTLDSRPIEPVVPTPAELGPMIREEQVIARRHMGRLPWEMVAWGLGNFVLWLSLWPLVFSGWLPLWAGFLLSCISMSLGYLPSHEAQHSIIGAEGTRWRWLNQLVGHVSTIPLVFPYRVAWITHKQHHVHANDPLKDPDYDTMAPTWWQSVWRSAKARQPMKNERYTRCLEESDDPMVQRALIEAAVMNIAFFSILTVLAWSGFALEAFFLWWLPKQFGWTYLQLFLSWAPHHPGTLTGRYGDTRAWKSSVGTILSMGMEYHIVHHLFPTIPLFQTGPAYWDLRETLEKRGVRNDGL